MELEGTTRRENWQIGENIQAIGNLKASFTGFISFAVVLVVFRWLKLAKKVSNTAVSQTGKLGCWLLS